MYCLIIPDDWNTRRFLIVSNWLFTNLTCAVESDFYYPKGYQADADCYVRYKFASAHDAVLFKLRFL